MDQDFVMILAIQVVIPCVMIPVEKVVELLVETIDHDCVSM